MNDPLQEIPLLADFYPSQTYGLESYRCAETERLIAEFPVGTWCKHEGDSGYCVVKDASNLPKIRKQCLICGGIFGPAVAKHAVRQPVPLADLEMFKRITAQRNEAYAHIVEVFTKARRSKYHDYLQTDEWRNKRRLVLERENHLCEGCLTARATEVHHLTYEDVRDEFLFQLVALCRGCHERWHGK